MKNGIEVFKTSFSDFADQYMIIGGVDGACRCRRLDLSSDRRLTLIWSSFARTLQKSLLRLSGCSISDRV